MRPQPCARHDAARREVSKEEVDENYTLGTCNCARCCRELEKEEEEEEGVYSS